MNIPAVVGHHVHVGVCWPVRGTVLSGTYNLTMNVILHEVPADAAPVHLRVCHSLSGVCPSAWRRTADIAVPLDANRDGSRSFTMPLDLSLAPTGVVEFRVNYEIRYTVSGQTREQFQSFGLLACVRSCSDSSPDRTLPYSEVRGWYTDREYQNARIVSDLSCLREGGVCRAIMKPGSGGDPTVETWAVIDPRFHDGDEGIVLMGSSGPFDGNITIPSDLPAGPHRLVLVASDGKNAGVGSWTFTAP